MLFECGNGCELYAGGVGMGAHDFEASVVGVVVGTDGKCDQSGFVSREEVFPGFFELPV